MLFRGPLTGSRARPLGQHAMKAIAFALIILWSVHLQAQSREEKLARETFDRALAFYKEENLDSAVALWKRMVETKMGMTSDLYGNAFFNVPTVYWMLNRFEEAKAWYIKILDSDLKDNEETGRLMEPHANYKYRSAVALAGLAMQDSNAVEALHWIHLADTVYRYWGFEGSATNVSKRQAYLLSWKSDLYRDLNQPEEAVRCILTELICAEDLSGFFDRQQDTLFKLIDKSSFRTELDAALDQMEIVRLNETNWLARFTLQGLPYSIPISNVYPDRSLPHYWTRLFIMRNTMPEKNAIVGRIKKSAFYARLWQ